MAGQPKTRAVYKILDKIGIEAICERIEAGESQSEIARSFGTSQQTVSKWLSQDCYSARATEAKLRSAESWMDRGLDTLLDAKVDVQRGREIAAHCRKMAAIRNPRSYGDRIEIEHTDGGLANALIEAAERAARLRIEQRAVDAEVIE